jgi:hypothetical protein
MEHSRERCDEFERSSVSENVYILFKVRKETVTSI